MMASNKVNDDDVFFVNSNTIDINALSSDEEELDYDAGFRREKEERKRKKPRLENNTKFSDIKEYNLKPDEIEEAKKQLSTQVPLKRVVAHTHATKVSSDSDDDVNIIGETVRNPSVTVPVQKSSGISVFVRCIAVPPAYTTTTMVRVPKSAKVHALKEQWMRQCPQYMGKSVAFYLNGDELEEDDSLNMAGIKVNCVVDAKVTVEEEKEHINQELFAKLTRERQEAEEKKQKELDDFVDVDSDIDAEPVLPENIILLKFQCSSWKDSLKLKIDKALTFGDIVKKKLVPRKGDLEGRSVKIKFDGDVVGFEEKPTDYDLEDEDQLDVIVNA